jgi:hypothetical protein
MAPKWLLLCRTKLLPIDQSSGSLQLEFFSAGQVAFMVEVVMD